jgi:plasmid stabilization system protein ParE
MSLEVRWTEEAEFTFDHIVSLIQDRWGTQSSNKFINKTKNTLLNISRQPFLFPESGIENVRKAVITKQSSAFYEVYPTHIMLVFFWDNRQYPLFV